MKYHVEVLTTPTADTKGFSLMLEFADKRYIIGNAHEGLQRAVVQRGKRLQKLNEVFLTGKVEWKNTGGLLGLVLSCADVRQSVKKASYDNFHEKSKAKLASIAAEIALLPEGSKKQALKIDQRRKEEIVQAQKFRTLQKELEKKRPMGIHGGSNIPYTVATARRFIFRKGMPLKVRVAADRPTPESWTPSWADENIEVYDMAVTPEITSQGPYPGGVSRKRTYKQYLERMDRPVNMYGEDQKLQLLQSTVEQMFNSDWTLDALRKVRLAEVKMPAKIYFREKGHKMGLWTGPTPGDVPEAELPDVEVYVREPWPGALIESLPSAQESTTAISYIFKGHPQRGKFLAKKAEELKVPVQKYKELAAGNSVVLDDGRKVDPQDVLEPAIPGRGFAVIDLPTRQHIGPLIERQEWHSSTLMEGIDTMFWNLGPGLMQNKSLQNFMENFERVHHVVTSPDHSANYITFESSAQLSIRLAAVDPFRMFPIPVHDNVSKALPTMPGRISLAHPGQSLILGSDCVWDTKSQLALLNSSEALAAISPETKRVAQESWKSLNNAEAQAEFNSQNIPGLDNEIITLGTGSSIPSKHRNVSATLLRVPGVGSYLFDAGENTLGQLSRIYPPSELNAVLKDLRMIWISHLHADHHLGITSVIKAWYEAKYPSGSDAGLATTESELKDSLSKFFNQDKLAVIAGNDMIQWLQEYSQIEDFGWSQCVDLSPLRPKPSSTNLYHNGFRTPFSFTSPDSAVRDALKALTGLVDLSIVFVQHCYNAMAVALTFEDGFKISYSGDCRPSAKFVEIGRGSTVLLHEATFEDTLKGDAMAKKHSTISEALQVGRAMQAKRILLTHFSQRYALVTEQMLSQDSKVKFEDASFEEASEMTMDGPVENVDDYDGDFSQAAAVVNSDDTTEVLREELASEDTGTKGKEAVDSGDSIQVFDGEAANDETGKENANQQGNARGDVDLPLQSKVEAGEEGEMTTSYSDVKVGVAFDYMRVKVRDIARLEKYNPIFSELLGKDGDASSKKES